MLKFSTLTRGNPSLPPLIFLHGFLGCKEDWEGFFPYFEDRYHCIAWDLPGHGSTPYCDHILRAVKEEIQRTCSKKPLLLGYSMGGRIALSLKEYASALIILCSHPGLKTQKEKDERLQIDKTWSEKLQTLPFDHFLKEWYAQPIFPPNSQMPPQRKRNQNPQSLSRVMTQMSLSSQEYGEDYPIPTLFLHGEKDLKYAELYRTLPKSVAVRSVDHSGHAVHLEQTLLCANHILNWLETYADIRRS